MWTNRDFWGAVRLNPARIPPIVRTMVTDIRAATGTDGRTLVADLLALPALRGR